MNDQAVLLAVATRTGRSESEHYGQLAVCDATGRLLYALGDPQRCTYMRSSAKPLQAVTCLLGGTRQKYAWSDDELAIVCASHSAEQRHQCTVRSILSKAGLTAADLQCGPHPPIDEGEYASLLRSGRTPQPLHSNCSGKHAGMLACCRANGWPVETCRDVGHPVQECNLQVLQRFTGLHRDAIGIGVDGCGVPTFHVSVQAMAVAYARLANPDVLDPADASAANEVAVAMTTRPQMIAGSGRFNTLLHEFAQGRLVAKSGAEGVFCAGIVEMGVGLAVKVTDGSSRPIPAILCRILADFLPELDWEAFARHANPPLKNTRGDVIGTIEATFSAGSGTT